MATTRREFFDRTLGLAAGALVLPRVVRAGTPEGVATKPATPRVERASKPLRILFLGGTGFIGPHMVRYAMYRGHQITLFNRGKSNADLFPGAETLLGDRDGKLDSLKGGKWDVVVDNSGYVPRHVRDSAKLLAPNVGRYVFISTGSVYAPDQDTLDEDAKLLKLANPASEDVNKDYGALKVVCEEAVREVYGSRGTILRLHIVAGPGDPTNRFTYWPVRIDAGGEVIAPGDPNAPVQFIDARDLAEFTLTVSEKSIPGTFNVAGPTLAPTSMAEFLYGIRGTTASPVSFTWIDDKYLADKKVRFQLAIPQTSPMRGLMRVKSNRGVEAGLKFRPLAVTAVDTLEWFKSQPVEDQKKLALNLDRDAQILAEFKAGKASGGGR
jgi:2'-hydroxyisoflavone reductase